MPLEGKQLGRYRLLKLVGSGGMGEVYLAEDSQVHRQVAAKVIRIEEDQSGEEAVASMLRHFLREATAIARLDHPNILPLYDHGEERQEHVHFAYLITPYRAEGSLVNWLRKRGQTQKTQQLTLKQVVHIIRQAADALQYAHTQQVIHQDVKPANFLVRSQSEADEYPNLLLADFGIALLASSTSGSSQNMRGTPLYMAPEQWANKAVFASDQYALAVMTYELLTGKPPFQGSPMNVMYAHLHEQPKPPREFNELLPATANEVLLRGLAKKPEERFPSVALFAQAFQAAFQESDAGMSLRMLPASPVTPQTPEIQRASDIRATLAISAEEARAGTRRALTLPGGRTVQVEIPPGSLAGQVLKLPGQGEVSATGAASDLYLTLSVVETSLSRSAPDHDAALTYRNPQPARPISRPPETFAQELTAPPTAQSGTRTQSQAPTVQTYPSAHASATFNPPSGDFSTQISANTPTVQTQQPLVLPGVQAQSAASAFQAASPAGPLGVQAQPIQPDAPTAQTYPPSGPPGTQMYPASSSAAPAMRAYPSSGPSGVQAQPHSPAGQTAPSGAFALPAVQPEPHTQNRWLRTTVVLLLLLLLLGGGGLGAYSAMTGRLHLFAPAATATAGTHQQAEGGTTTPAANAGATATVQAGAATASAQASATSSSTTAQGTATTSAGYPGQTWTALTPITQYTLHAVVWSGSQFVAVGGNGAILTSSNGKNWSDRTASSGTQQKLNALTWSGSLFVVVGDNDTILTSPNGQNWSVQHPLDVVQNLNGVSWSGSLFVVVGDGGTVLLSTDGQNWHPPTSPVTSYNLRAVRWSGSQFIVVGYNGRILTSADGNTWADRSLSGSPASLPNLEGVRSGAGTVAVGDGGTIARSSNGQQWNLLSSGTTANLMGITWSGSLYVVVGSSGTVLTSPDGQTWSSQNAGTPQNLQGVAWSGSQFVAVGDGGTVLTSS